MKIDYSSKRFTNILLILFTVISITAFSFILINRNPFLIRPASVAVRYGYTISVPLIFGLFTACVPPRKNHRGWHKYDNNIYSFWVGLKWIVGQRSE